MPGCEGHQQPETPLRRPGGARLAGSGRVICRQLWVMTCPVGDPFR
jgi:hypothetical protein